MILFYILLIFLAGQLPPQNKEPRANAPPPKRLGFRYIERESRKTALVWTVYGLVA